MKVSWSKRAGKSLNDTASYIHNAFGEKAKFDFVQEIQHITNLLESNPYAGKTEPLLLHKTRAYRSIVLNRQNKIIYYLNKNTIRIAAIWDTRREPKKLTEGLK